MRTYEALKEKEREENMDTISFPAEKKKRTRKRGNRSSADDEFIMKCRASKEKYEKQMEESKETEYDPKDLRLDFGKFHIFDNNESAKACAAPFLTGRLKDSDKKRRRKRKESSLGKSEGEFSEKITKSERESGSESRTPKKKVTLPKVEKLDLDNMVAPKSSRTPKSGD